MSRRRQQSIDHALRVLLKRALQQWPVIGNGSPLESEYVSKAYEIPTKEVERVFAQLVADGTAMKDGGGYSLNESMS